MGLEVRIESVLEGLPTGGGPELRSGCRPIIERAIARGDIPTGSDPELIMDLLFGPLYHRYLNMHLPLDASFARGVARMVAAGAKAGAAA
jgi:hypothetical protein